ncbi:MAG: 30S ribosome-binding factor RbfA [Clostridia bacterium]
MKSKRNSRIGEELKREISNIFLYDIKDPRLQGMVSVLNVTVTNDLSYAKIFISIMGGDEEKKESMKAIKSSLGFIRKEIAGRLNLRHVPELRFVYDDSIDKSFQINSILESLKNGK